MLPLLRHGAVVLMTPTEIRAHRVKLGLSTERLAKLIGVDIRTIQHWESGKRRPKGPEMRLLLLLETPVALAKLEEWLSDHR